MSNAPHDGQERENGGDDPSPRFGEVKDNIREKQGDERDGERDPEDAPSVFAHGSKVALVPDTKPGPFSALSSQ